MKTYKLVDKICLLHFFSSIEDPAIYFSLNIQVIFYASFYAKVKPPNILYMINTLTFKDKLADDRTMDMEYLLWKKAYFIDSNDNPSCILYLSLYRIKKKIKMKLTKAGLVLP